MKLTLGLIHSCSIKIVLSGACVFIRLGQELYKNYYSQA